MKLIKILTLLCFLSIGFSQNNQKHSVFIKAQYIPSIGINYKITNHISFRPALLVESLELDVALLFNIFENKKLTYYAGPSFTPFFKIKGSYSIGLLAGAQFQLSNKFSLFGEFGADLSVSGDGHKNTHLKKSGVGIHYYFGK